MSNERKKTASVESKSAPSTFVYIGPSLPNGQLKSGTVFRGQRSEVLKHLEGVTTKHPEVLHLLVQSGEVATAKRKLQSGESLLTENYKALQKQIKN